MPKMSMSDSSTTMAARTKGMGAQLYALMASAPSTSEVGEAESRCRSTAWT